MTKINRLTIQGFKSFAHKTDIFFDKKFNVILGPNGVGKSNLSDGICFVLGRLSAKSLRAEKAANLIFNGGKKKKPADRGTVEIAFDNQSKIFPRENSEIVLSRTITKTGNSIYRLNGKKHTRTEILDLLAAAKINPEGYNIILQGDINRFVDMSPLERRKIIESISDISLYEEKKHKALLEMEKVEEKLNNAEIVLKERHTHLKELKKDHDQALKFKDLKEKIDSNKATYLDIQLREKTQAREQYDSQITQFQDKNREVSARIEQLKGLIQKNKELTKEINQQIEEKGEKEQLRVHRNLEELKVALAKNRERISTLKDELTKIAQRKQQFSQELLEHDQKIKELRREQQQHQQQLDQKTAHQQEIDRKIAQFKKKNKLEDTDNLEKKLEDCDKTIEQEQERIQKLRQQQQDLFREKDRLEFQLHSLDEKVKKVREIEKENQLQLSQLKKNKEDFKKLTLNLNHSLTQDSEFAARLTALKKDLLSLQEQQARLTAQSLSQKEKLFYNIAIKKILEQKNIKGIYGTIAQLGKVSRKYSRALEAAAGSKTNFIVVEDDKVAAACIRYLKSNRFGSASFIPLNKIKTPEIPARTKKLVESAGAHDLALNLISFDKKYLPAFQYVFGGTLIVDNIETARKIGIGAARMVTLDGDLAEISGVMKGGFRQKAALPSFLEKDSQDELRALELSLEEKQSLLLALQTKREANEQEISSLRNQKSELEAELIKMEKTLHLGSSDLDASQEQKKELAKKLKEVEQSLSQLQKDISPLNKVLAETKTRRQLLRTEISQLKDPRLLAQLSAFEETKNKFREDLAALKTEIRSIDDKISELILPEKNKILDILKQHQKEEEKFSQEISRLKSLISQKEKELKVKEKESVEFYSKYRALFNQREKLSNEISQKEEEIEGLRDRTRSSEIEINKLSLKNAEVKAKLAALEEEFKHYQDAPLLKNKSEEELKKEINRFEALLSQMSTVNLKALEVYERVESEYQKLIEKKQGLHKEKEDILIMMNEIETKKKEHFFKTLEVINQNFRRIFSALFRKGDAHLELENPDHPFEEGLNIKVRLTGNRFMDIKSLSGGEKSLTALSFIFAIQEHQPASFYILDEIDAALDKHNSETLSKLISSYSEKAQYVIISHNDSIISEADTLYGISMDEFGISKVTSLRI